MMSANYAKALDAALVPLGFVRDRNDWTRVRNDIAQVVVRNVGKSGGTAVQLFSWDVETERLFTTLEVEIGKGGLPWVATQTLLWPDGRSRWWTSDEPDGVTTMRATILEQGMIWFDRINTLEDQAEIWFHRSQALNGRQYNVFKQIVLALTLYRLGEYDEAYAVLYREPNRRLEPIGARELEIARAWIAKQVPSRS